MLEQTSKHLARDQSFEVSAAEADRRLSLQQDTIAPEVSRDQTSSHHSP